MPVRRRIVRERVVQALYAYEMTGAGLDHLTETVLFHLQKDNPALQFARTLVAETIKHRTDIDSIITAKVANWDLHRIALLDRVILRMAICELLYFREIPPKVSMNEAIEIAKLFSTEWSGHFINGVLDAIYEDLRASGELVKTGRGLSTKPLPRREDQSSGKKKRIS